MSSSDQSSTLAGADPELQAARRHVLAGRSADAEESYRHVLKMLPSSIEALVFLGNAAQARGEGGDAVNLLSRASKADPLNVDTLLHLGAAYRAAERFDAARHVLERAVRLAAGRHPYARLSLARVLELDRRPELALLHYCLALLEAQRLRRWTSDDDKMLGLRVSVAHARQFVDAGRRAWFERVLRNSGQGATAERGARIEAALVSYLDARPPMLADPRQRAGLLDVPGIATTCFIDQTRFEWLDRVPGMLVRCIDEMRQCIASSVCAEQTPVDAGVIRLSVFKAGIPQYEARRHAPLLLAALRELPLADVPHHAPDVHIISLPDEARFASHYGRTNSRCWAIVNPGGGALQVIVGGESRVLPPAAALVADPSFGVEYLNVGGSPSLALVLEVWHPDLGDSEQRAIAGLITAVLDFDQRLQDLD